MSIKKRKISDFPAAQTLEGFRALGVNDQGENVQAGLGFVQTAAEEALEAASEARTAAEVANASAQIVENITGASVTLGLAGGHTYICGELASLTIGSVEDSPLSAVVRFRSGATATTLVLPDTLRIVGYARPEANCNYELDVANRLAVIIRF